MLTISGWPGVFLSIAGFLFFTDMCIYWIHRIMHHPNIYKVSLSLFLFLFTTFASEMNGVISHQLLFWFYDFAPGQIFIAAPSRCFYFKFRF